MRDYLKLFAIALCASLATALVLKVTEPQPVYAAEAEKLLPPEFVAGTGLSFGVMSKGGTIVETHGDWIHFKNEKDDWWVRADAPTAAYWVTKAK
jgi:hypothetical protein